MRRWCCVGFCRKVILQSARCRVRRAHQFIQTQKFYAKIGAHGAPYISGFINKDNTMNDKNIFQNNHIKLMKIHQCLAIFYAIILLVIEIFLFSNGVGELSVQLMPILIFAFPIILHIVLAIGAREKNDLARQVSVAIFVLMFLCVPIGTILSMMVFLPATQWHENDEN